ncbi:MAG: hypothetical protein F6K48_12285 [Okeania sp. SIO3H1]|uniref:hypothetical protein n=1 Tax=Okeania sp. SIO1I7 TaxID=2607772 RepID=UPI0013CB1193|nr:hypothetical protein [Okeania sp. SIO1I7]NEN89636.1 hypothetical protein [Okeania sp. SIO3H1]NET27660.1 hypothetical protein [Okeania sp. SIO1I7]
MGRWGDGEMGRWGPTPRPSPSQEGNVGGWGDGEIKTPRNKNLLHSFRRVTPVDTAYFWQMRYRVNDENIVLQASCTLRGVPHGQRKALYNKPIA